MNYSIENSTIDIVLPCYNPSEGWERRVLSNYNELCRLHPDYAFNLFVVTDGSTRGYNEETVSFLKESIPSFTLVDYKTNMGKGYALRTAVKECCSGFIIYIDYDFPYTWDSLDNVINALRSGSDVVVAVRNCDYQRSLPRFRKILSYSSHMINKVLLGLKITDTQGGMKGFNRRGREIFLTTTINSFLFDTQFIYKASHTKGIKVTAVDARIKEGIHMSVMGMKVLRREFRNIFVILFNR